MNTTKLYGLLAGMMTSLGGFAAAGGGFMFLADSVVGDQGMTVVVPIRAAGFDSILSIQGTVGWDSGKLTYLGVQNMGLPSMSGANFGVSYTANGRLTFSWNENNLAPISVPDSTVLFAVAFQVTGQQGEDVGISFLGTPTLLEVVDWSYTQIPYSLRPGNVHIHVPPICELPDSLAAGNVSQTDAELSWVSTNGGATYQVEWGPWGYVQGNGMGMASGVSTPGRNAVMATNLQAGAAYEFYVTEHCDSLVQVQSGPAGFATTAPPPVHATVILYGDSVMGYPQAQVNIDLHALQFTDIVSAQGSVEWNPAVVNFLGITHMGLPGMNMGNFGTSQAGQGKLTFSWNDPSLQGVTLSDSAVLFGLEMQLTGVGGAACAIDLPDLPLAMEVVDTSLTVIADSAIPGYARVLDTVVGLPTAASHGVVLYPHPLREGSSFRLRLPDAHITVTHVQWVNAEGQSLPDAVTWQQVDHEILCQLSPAVAAGAGFLRLYASDGVPYVIRLVNRH